LKQEKEADAIVIEELRGHNDELLQISKKLERQVVRMEAQEVASHKQVQQSLEVVSQIHIANFFVINVYARPTKRTLRKRIWLTKFSFWRKTRLI
jgi:hypothetical protein